MNRSLPLLFLLWICGCQGSQIWPQDVDGCWEFTLYYDVDAKNQAAWVQIYREHFDDLAHDSSERDVNRKYIAEQQRGILVTQMLEYLKGVATVRSDRLSDLDRKLREIDANERKALEAGLIRYRDGGEAPSIESFESVLLPGFISNLVGYGVTTMETRFPPTSLWMIVQVETKSDGYYKDYYWPGWERNREREVVDPAAESKTARSVTPGPIYGVSMSLGSEPDDRGVFLFSARTEREYEFVLVQSLGKFDFSTDEGPAAFNEMPFRLTLALEERGDDERLHGVGPIRSVRDGASLVGEAFVRRQADPRE